MKNTVQKFTNCSNEFTTEIAIDTTTKFNDFVVTQQYKKEAVKRIDIQIEDENNIMSINGISLAETEVKMLFDFLKLYTTKLI